MKKGQFLSQGIVWCFPCLAGHTAFQWKSAFCVQFPLECRYQHIPTPRANSASRLSKPPAAYTHRASSVNGVTRLESITDTKSLSFSYNKFSHPFADNFSGLSQTDNVKACTWQQKYRTLDQHVILHILHILQGERIRGWIGVRQHLLERPFFPFQ
jgi:hypothetical protein